MKMNEVCRKCLLDKNIAKVPAGADAAQAEAYCAKVREIVAQYA